MTDQAPSIAAGLLAFGMWLTGIVIDSSSVVPIGAAASVGIGIWYLASRLQRQDDRLEEIQRILSALPCSKDECQNGKNKK